MKTRTLLLLAVVCGLVILVAGSVKLFLLANDKPPTQLSIGESAKVGDMTVTVDSAKVADGQLLVGVTLIGVDDPQGALKWIFGNGGKEPFTPVSPPAAQGEPCGATKADEAIDCVLAFPTDNGDGVLRYERAGSAARWKIENAS